MQETKTLLRKCYDFTFEKLYFANRETMFCQPRNNELGLLTHFFQQSAEFGALSQGEIWRLQKKVVFLPPLTGWSGKLTI